MLEDYLYYMSLKISDWQENLNRQKEKRKQQNRKPHYIFQKAAICIAVTLWLVTAINVLYNSRAQEPSSGEKIISAFSSSTYLRMTSSVSAYGKYGSINLTDNAKQMILEKIAQQIGISHYEITDYEDENSAVKTLSQNSVNGDVICRFITQKPESEGAGSNQYIYIDVMLKNSIEATFTYEEIVREIVNELEMAANVNVNLMGEISGDLDMHVRDSIANQILEQIGAKVIAENRDDELYTIYAYDSGIEEYLTVGRERVNVNISMAYDEERDVTEVYFATPINNQDY